MILSRQLKAKITPLLLGIISLSGLILAALAYTRSGECRCSHDEHVLAPIGAGGELIIDAIRLRATTRGHDLVYTADGLQWEDSGGRLADVSIYPVGDVGEAPTGMSLDFRSRAMVKPVSLAFGLFAAGVQKQVALQLSEGRRPLDVLVPESPWLQLGLNDSGNVELVSFGR